MRTPTPSPAPAHGVAWWLAWILVTVLLLGGVYLAVQHVDTTPAAIDTRH